MYQAAMRYQVTGLKDLSEEKLVAGLATARTVSRKSSLAMFDPKLQEVMLPKLQVCMSSLMQSSPFSNLLIKNPHFGLDILRAEYAPGCQRPAITPMATPNPPHTSAGRVLDTVSEHLDSRPKRMRMVRRQYDPDSESD